MRVFDSSALLAMIFGEPGGDKVAALIAQGDGTISCVNLAEVLTKVRDQGMDEAAVEQIRTELPLTLSVLDFDAEAAALTGQLRTATRSLGLSLGDRSCLAVARLKEAEVITADRPWKALKGFRITLIR